MSAPAGVGVRGMGYPGATGGVVVDSSALLALLLDEPEALRFAEAMARASRLRMPAPGWIEAAMLLDRRGNAIARARLDEFRLRFGLEIAAFTADHAAIAREALRTFGRGTGHPARLNFGDCIAYAFAKHEREPLLFKGEEFLYTDVEPALKD